MIDELRPFQHEFIRRATGPGIDTACLSLPRGNGKSALAGHLVTRILTPDDPLFVAGTESVLCAASIEQARIVFRFARGELEEVGGYRFLDSHTRIGAVHKATNTRLRIIGSNGRTAMGLVGCPWAICDEPGAWEVNGGTLLHDAIQTAMGKPGSPLRALYIGTLAPATAGWWHDLVDDGSHGSTVVHALRGDPERWDQWPEIQRVNPLTAISPAFRRKLLDERDAARADTRLKARFMSYRLNVPSGDESTMLLTVDDWERVTAREVPEREGQPIVGLDLGAGRAWSAAVGVRSNGRVEALAVAPGIPDLAAQEKRDRVPAGVYQKLHESGALRVSEGLRVQPPGQLVAAVREEWGAPAAIFCDRFRLPELQDCARGLRIRPRVSRWSEASADIRGLRKLARDGPLAVAAGSRDLMAASLAAALVKNDDQGSTRLAKRAHNVGRDDVAAAFLLGAGALARKPKRGGGVYHGLTG